jgi:hypothetical protein
MKMIILALRHAGLRFILNYYVSIPELGHTQLSKARSPNSTSHSDVSGVIHGSRESLHVACIRPKVYVLDVGNGCNILAYLRLHSLSILLVFIETVGNSVR